jgi:AcrR family transcriptional regulator
MSGTQDTGERIVPDDGESVEIAKLNLDQSNRRALILRYAIEGLSIRQIAARIGVSKSQVGRDFQDLHREFAAYRRQTYAEYVDAALAELEYIRSEAAKAWARSKQPTSVKIRGAKQGKIAGVSGASIATVHEKTVDQIGDPRFLRVMLESLLSRMKLLDLQVPRQFIQQQDKQDDGAEDAKTAADRRVMEKLYDMLSGSGESAPPQTGEGEPGGGSADHDAARA